MVAPVLPLSRRGADPDQAGTVATAEVLADDFPHLARACLDPTVLLKDVLTFDGSIPRPFTLLGPSYPEFVENAVASGSQVLKEPSELKVVDGQLVVSGGFSVGKDDVEDRVISPLEMTNDLTDNKKLDPVVYPYLPEL